MVVVFAVVAVLVVLLVWAIYTEEVPPEAEAELLPAWEDFPAVDDITRAGFPLAVLGYDQQAVHQHLERVAQAFQAALTAREAVEVLNQRDRQSGPESGEDGDHPVGAKDPVGADDPVDGDREASHPGRAADG